MTRSKERLWQRDYKLYQAERWSMFLQTARLRQTLQFSRCNISSHYVKQTETVLRLIGKNLAGHREVSPDASLKMYTWSLVCIMTRWGVSWVRSFNVDWNIEVLDAFSEQRSDKTGSDFEYDSRITNWSFNLNRTPWKAPWVINNYILPGSQPVWDVWNNVLLFEASSLGDKGLL